MVEEKDSIFWETVRHQILFGIIALLSLIFFSSYFYSDFVIPNLIELNKQENRICRFVFNITTSFFLTFCLLYLRHHLRRYKEAKRKAGIADGAYLTCYNSNRDAIEIILAETELRNVSNNSEDICVLGASGLRTFGAKNSPLFDAFQNCNKIRVLLLYPDGEAIKRRAKSLFTAQKSPKGTYDDFLENYRKEIKESVDMLQKIHSISEGKVELAFYDELPLLKIIIIDHTLIWLQHYEAGEHVRDLPCYFLEKEKEQDGIGLFRAVTEVFDRKWGYQGKYIFDFERGQIWNPQKELYENLLGN